MTVGNLGDLSLEGNNKIDSIQVNGSLRLGGSNTIAYLEVAAGAELRLDAGETQRPDTLVLPATAEERVTLRGLGSPQPMIDFSRHEKICYDYINVEGVDITGKSGGNGRCKQYAQPCARLGPTEAAMTQRFRISLPNTPARTASRSLAT